MNSVFNQGDTAYFVESKWRIREVRIIKAFRRFATIRFRDDEDGIRIHDCRLFPSKEAAGSSISQKRTTVQTSLCRQTQAELESFLSASNST